MSSVYKPTSEADMLAGFPESIGMIVGRPTSKSLFRALRHLMECSQSHKVEGNNGLNLLHIAVTGAMCVYFMRNPAGNVPALTPDPGQAPQYAQGMDDAQRANVKLLWECAKMKRKEERNMNGALIKRLLQIIPTDYKTDFKVELAEVPNMTFQNAFLWFHNRYGMADENDRDDNRKAMDFEWTIDDNFPALSRRLDECLLYSAYLDMPYSNDEMVDAALRIILRTGQLTQEYQDWKE